MRLGDLFDICQRLQERDDGFAVGLGEIDRMSAAETPIVDLVIHGGAQSRDAAVVHVRRVLRDIAQ